ncbi:hypothetical protein AALK14_01005 [Butyricimonas hominis]|uniref:hypothetical protein n=1 Tax=Butyricimonas TaxID=574697 RepID=UPI003513881F
MKNLKFLLVIFLGSIVWNCANPGLGDEDGELPSVKSFYFTGKFDIDKLLKTGYPPEFGASVSSMSWNTMGFKLLNIINTGKPYIYFVEKYNFTENGEVKMEFAGGGKIYYSSSAIEFEFRDEIIFHEFFHILQNGNNSPVKSRNNEVEAYVAQILYARGKGGSSIAPPIDECSGDLIKQMASLIDENTGELRDKKDEAKFRGLYFDALVYLEGHPSYSNENGYFSDYLDYSLPNLVKLLKYKV